MHQKPKKLKNVKWNKNFGCPGRISFFAFFNTYMYLVSKNISPGLREFLVNQCLVSQGVQDLWAGCFMNFFNDLAAFSLHSYGNIYEPQRLVQFRF